MRKRGGKTSLELSDGETGISGEAAALGQRREGVARRIGAGNEFLKFGHTVFVDVIIETLVEILVENKAESR